MTLSFQNILDTLNSKANSAIEDTPNLVDSKQLPDQEDVKLEVPQWNCISNTACLFVDMVGSSQIDFTLKNVVAARIYEAFLGSITSAWNLFGATHYDIKGDGGFAIFDGDDSSVRAFLAGETIRTNVCWYLRGKVSKLTSETVSLRTRTSLSFGDVVVKRIGQRGAFNNNLVWLGSTINQGAKLLEEASGIVNEEELVASEAAYEQLEHDKIRKSCNCKNPKSNLWNRCEASEELRRIGIPAYYKLRSFWCRKCGPAFFQSIVNDYGLTL